MIDDLILQIFADPSLQISSTKCIRPTSIHSCVQWNHTNWFNQTQHKYI